MSEIKAKKHRQIALESLEKNPITRNCDWDLYFDALYRQEGIRIPEEIRNALKLSKVNFKTLMRERQNIQRHGLLLPTDPKVASRRSKRAVEFANEYSQN